MFDLCVGYDRFLPLVCYNASVRIFAPRGGSVAEGEE